jgi:hypothetical protein
MTWYTWRKQNITTKTVTQTIKRIICYKTQQRETITKTVTQTIKRLITTRNKGNKRHFQPDLQVTSRF